MPDSSLRISFLSRSYFNNPDPDFEWTRGRLLCYTTRVVNDEPLLDSTAILRCDTLLSLTSWDTFSFVCNEYQPGDTVAVVFRANSMPRNYRIDDFSVEAFFDTTSTDTTHVNPLPDTLWRTVTLLCDSTMGTVSGGGVYPDSSVVTISATPFEGYHFEGWSMVPGYANVVTDNPLTFTLTDDVTVTAFFAADSLPAPPPDTVWRTVTVTTNAVGACEPYGSGVYPDSSIVEIGYMMTDIGTQGGHWEFLGWNDGDTANPRHILVTSDTAIVALFEWIADSVDINELSIFNSQFSIYPNPASTTVTIEAANSEPLTVTIFDINGRQVYTNALTQSSTNAITLDISHWPAGTYFVRLKELGIVKKLIIR